MDEHRDVGQHRIVMEAKSDSRFDPNTALQLLLDIAHEHSLDQLLQKLVNHAVERPYMSCVQIWLVEPADRCANCEHRAVCRDPTRCLHLVAGKGVSLTNSAATSRRFDDLNARNPLGVGLLG